MEQERQTRARERGVKQTPPPPTTPPMPTRLSRPQEEGDRGITSLTCENQRRSSSVVDPGQKGELYHRRFRLFACSVSEFLYSIVRITVAAW